MSSQLTVPGTPDENWRQIVERLTEELTDDIPEKVVRATELLLSGFPVGKAAKEIGVSSDTIKSWIRKYPTVAHVLSEGRRYLQLWRMAQLEQQFVKAIGKSEEILDLSLHDDSVNVKLAGIQAQHARYLIGLFAGQQVDINVRPSAEDPVLKAKADALDYLAQRLAENRQSGEVVTVNYHVVDERSKNAKPLLNADGDPNFGQLGVLDVNEEGALCHICGKRQKLMSVHISKDHDMRVRDYEAAFLLDEGIIGQHDSTDFEE
jgi:DNA-binding transcriptional MerR regulator